MDCLIVIVLNKGDGSTLFTKQMCMKNVVEVALGRTDIPIIIKVFTC